MMSQDMGTPKLRLIRGSRKEQEQKIMDHLQRQEAYGEEWEPVSLSLQAEAEYPEAASHLRLLIFGLEDAASNKRKRERVPEIFRLGARGLIRLAEEMERQCSGAKA